MSLLAFIASTKGTNARDQGISEHHDKPIRGNIWKDEGLVINKAGPHRIVECYHVFWIFLVNNIENSQTGRKVAISKNTALMGSSIFDDQ